MSKPSPPQLDLLASPGSTSSSAAFRARTCHKPTPTGTASTGSGPACSGGASTPSTPSSPEPSRSRTSVDSLGGVWTLLSPSSTGEVLRWNARGSRLGTLACPTNESGYSSWPTPTASNPNEGESIATWEARRERLIAKGYNGNGMGEPLGMAVRREDRAATGLLNPSWVEFLMSFPAGWTDPYGPPLVEPPSDPTSRAEPSPTTTGDGSNSTGSGTP